MKIPHSLRLLNDSSNISSDKQFQLLLEQTKHWITTAEAAALTRRQNSFIVKQIQNGTLTGRLSDSHPANQRGEPTYIVLLEDLPSSAQYNHWN